MLSELHPRTLKHHRLVLTLHLVLLVVAVMTMCQLLSTFSLAHTLQWDSISSEA